MIFDKEMIKRLHLRIENNTNVEKNWVEIILGSLEKTEDSCLSEFELYGNFVAKNIKILRPWRQKALKKCNLTSCDSLKKEYYKYWSITFSSYLN
jgi:hypothetical protein